MESVNQLSIANPFEINYKALEALTEKVTSVEFIHFEALAELITRTLHLMELDIYIPARFDSSNDLLSKITNIITNCLAHNQNNLNFITKVLFLLSQNNIELYYDYGWLYEEKHTYFKVIIQTITQQAHQLLIDFNTSTTNTQNFSTETIAKLTYASAVWKFKPERDMIDLLLLTMQKLLQQDLLLTAETAFQFIDGIFRLCPTSVFKQIHGSADLFSKLASTCVEMLLRDEPPLQMYPSYYLALNRISRIKQLLPQPDLEKHKRLYFQLTQIHMARYGYVDFNKLYADLPEYILPYKRLVVALDSREEELYKISKEQEDYWYDNSRSYRNREENKTYYTMGTYIKYIKQLMVKNNPKGLQWLIMKYSQSIISCLSSTTTTYLLGDIKDFLKILRHSVWDFNIPDIKTAVTKLCSECLSTIHFNKIDSTIAIDLLWINMVLTIILNDDSIRYTEDQQIKLSKKINCGINKEQARELFEIETLQWHGNQPFPESLKQEMQRHFKKLKDDVNASEAETHYYQKIALILDEAQHNLLKKNLICNFSGHEIDIAYIGIPKIAINVDGPSHFNPVTGKRTPKTIFRNHCLEKAGWLCFDINIKEFQEDSNQWQILLGELKRLLNSNSNGSNLVLLQHSIKATEAKQTQANHQELMTMKELELKLGYIFKNEELLRQALTRESAIQEKLPNAAKQSYQTLEFVGDAALKHAISKILFEKIQGKFTEGELHDCTKKLISNENTLPEIADDIGLSQFIIKGKGEKEVTSNMKADTLEAILGAISINNHSQENLFHTVAKLWEAHLKKVIDETVKVKSVAKNQIPAVKLPASNLETVINHSNSQNNNNNNQSGSTINKMVVQIIDNDSSKAIVNSDSNLNQPGPHSPRTQRMFSGLGGTFPIDKFEETLRHVPDINRKNIGKLGDTALMMLLRKKKLRESIEIPKIEALLKHGALWATQNNQGESADDLAKNHDKKIILRLKNIK